MLSTCLFMHQSPKLIPHIWRTKLRNALEDKPDSDNEDTDAQNIRNILNKQTFPPSVKIYLKPS